MRPRLVVNCLVLSTAFAGLARSAQAPRAAEHSDTSPDESSQLEVRASVEHWARYYGYRQRVTGALREYVLEGAPALGIDVDWLPLVWAEDEVRAGLKLGYARLLHAVSRIHDAELATESHSLSLGFEARFRATRSVETAYELLYGEHSYIVEDTFVPDPRYRFVRPGAVVRVELWRLRVAAGGGLRFLVDTGDLESPTWFPEVGGMGLDAELRGGFVLTEALAVLAGVRWRTYRFTLNPDPRAPSPGGTARLAFDYYLDTFAALELRL